MFPTFNRVTRIDFTRVATTYIRLDLRGGHRDFLREQFFFGIRRIEVVGCRANVSQLLWQPPERKLVEQGLRKVHRDEHAHFSEEELEKKLYMPGEALKDAVEICKAGKFPSWSLTVESGIFERYQVWPGTKTRSRMQLPQKSRWTKQDPAHPFYWMSPRERVKRYHMHRMQEQKMLEDLGIVQDEDMSEWDQESRSGWSPVSTRPSSAQASRPRSGMQRSSSKGNYSVSRASTRPTTADTSRAGTRPSTPSRPSGRSSSAGVYEYRFGRPSTAGKERPGSASFTTARVTEECEN